MSEHDPIDDYDDEPWRGRPTPDNALNWTSTSIWACGVVQLVLSGLGLRLVVVPFVDRSGPGHPDANDFEEAIALLFIVLVSVALNGLIIFGTARMRRFRSHNLSLVAAGLTCLSLPFIFLAPFTIPLGIWAVFFLLRRDVLERFRTNQARRDRA